MRRYLAAIALLTTTFMFAGCNETSDNLAACTIRMRSDFQNSYVVPSRPPECNGVSDRDLQRIVNELMAEKLSKG
jgi:hypothetical protein